MINLIEFKKQIREILEKYADIIDSSKAASKEEKIAKLQPHETVPGNDVLETLTPENEAKFDEEVKPLKNKGIILVNDVLAKIQEKRTEAPTTEAVNYISMLKLKKDVSEKEIEQALEQYGDTYIVYEALQQIAQDNDIYIDDNRIDSIEEVIESIANTIRKMGAVDARRTTRGHILMVLYGMDINLPDEI